MRLTTPLGGLGPRQGVYNSRNFVAIGAVIRYLVCVSHGNLYLDLSTGYHSHPGPLGNLKTDLITASKLHVVYFSDLHCLHRLSPHLLGS